MSHSDFTVVSLAEPADLSAMEDDDPDCCDSLNEFARQMIASVIADLNLVANVLTANPEMELPERTWFAISNAFQVLSDETQYLRN